NALVKTLYNQANVRDLRKKYSATKDSALKSKQIAGDAANNVRMMRHISPHMAMVVQKTSPRKEWDATAFVDEVRSRIKLRYHSQLTWQHLEAEYIERREENVKVP